MWHPIKFLISRRCLWCCLFGSRAFHGTALCHETGRGILLISELSLNEFILAHYEISSYERPTCCGKDKKATFVPSVTFSSLHHLSVTLVVQSGLSGFIIVFKIVIISILWVISLIFRMSPQWPKMEVIHFDFISDRSLITWAEVTFSIS